MLFKLSEVEKLLKGKVIKNLEWGNDKFDYEKQGETNISGAKILSATLGLSEGREDAGLWLELDDDRLIFVYPEETIEIQE